MRDDIIKMKQKQKPGPKPKPKGDHFLKTSISISPVMREYFKEKELSPSRILRKTVQETIDYQDWVNRKKTKR